MSKKNRVAIVGLGCIAWKYNASGETRAVLTHGEAYRHNPETEIVAGCSPEKEDREGFAASYGSAVFETADQMLAETSVDIVSICSPAEFHFEHTVKCLEVGIPMVWLEKPPSIDVSEIRGLVEMHRTCESTVLVNYQRRYCDSYRELRQIY